MVYMHRFLMNPAVGMTVDHINKDTLDNRKANLRVCTNQQNVMGKCGHGASYKGVSFYKRTGKWVAKIKHNYVTINLGYFDDETEAALAYNKKAKELFGEYATLNEE
jgi:hypothetical protein